MEEKKARELVVEGGKELLKRGLVARTWGNVSCRLDADNFAITPSGLDYTKLREADIVKMNLTTGEWDGIHKPSGEKGVHIAAYQVFPAVNFVIHTHQTYATALGLAGFETMDITEEEKEKLGGIALAPYGLSGTKKITNGVKTALQTGAMAVLMIHHGALICGVTQEETIGKAILLEEICKRNLKGSFASDNKIDSREAAPFADTLLGTIKSKYQYAALVQTPAVLACADRGKSIFAQVDDMAQMIGRTILVASKNPADIFRVLDKKAAVLVPGVGAVVHSASEDDTYALGLLVDKAAVCSIHTEAWHTKARLGSADVALQYLVYKKKYAKKKG